MDGFYWLIPNGLAGCGRPGRRGRAAGPPEVLDADLAWLRQQGIAAILSLTETPLDEESLSRHGFAWLHLPVVDLSPPAPEQLREALAFIDHHRGHGRPVAVHCLMGQGRTGTVLAAYLIRDGLRPELALAELRAVCPGAVENPRQEAALEEFAAARAWVL
ncbi:MAG TPA: dual specificity protein phosphatase family protein [Thermomicrobiales bacterium]|jgi:atypical dual specificity phosphatase